MAIIRLKRRPQPLTSPLANLSLILGSVVVAMLVCMVPISLVGVNPLQAYGAMLSGEGQIYLGALGATLVGLAFTNLPLWLMSYKHQGEEKQHE